MRILDESSFKIILNNRSQEKTTRNNAKWDSKDKKGSKIFLGNWGILLYHTSAFINCIMPGSWSLKFDLIKSKIGKKGRKSSREFKGAHLHGDKSKGNII